MDSSRLAEGASFGRTLAAALRQSATLTSLNLSSNNLGDGESDYVHFETVQVRRRLLEAIGRAHLIAS